MEKVEAAIVRMDGNALHEVERVENSDTLVWQENLQAIDSG